MRPVTIKAGNVRDLSWITARMRPLDRIEVAAQLTVTDIELAYVLSDSTRCYVACYKDRPTMAFGYNRMCDAGVSIWAIGSEKARRCAPEITRFFMQQLIPQLWDKGVRWGEARSIASHAEAHRWMQSTGAEAVLTLPHYGKRGETFVLFRWTWHAFRSILEEHIQCSKTPTG